MTVTTCVYPSQSSVLTTKTNAVISDYLHLHNLKLPAVDRTSVDTRSVAVDSPYSDWLNLRSVNMRILFVSLIAYPRVPPLPVIDTQQ